MNQVSWATFFDSNPYDGFDYQKIPADIQGWNSKHPIFATIIKTIQPKIICEVGSWKGASAIHMAKLCENSTRIICIDTWLGTIESYTWKADEPKLHEDLQLKHGWPQLFYTFLANVMHSGCSELIIPLPQTSLIGARILKELEILVDVVYIDASHDYCDAKADLAAFYEVTRDGGILFGDDYDWPDISCAVDEFVDDKGLALLKQDNKYALAKNANVNEILKCLM